MCGAEDKGHGEEGGSGYQGEEDSLRHTLSSPPVAFRSTTQSSYAQPEHLSTHVKGKHDFPYTSQYPLTL